MLMQTRGAKTGTCNICGEFGKLTEDHTPPKGVVRIGRLELHHITQRLSPSTESQKWRSFQNGVKYRTLCGDCNNGLGHHDDPALISFSEIVHRVMSARSWPRSAGVARPQNIMRSVIGHLCAQGVERFRKGPATERIAWYVTDRALTLPTSIRIFWWPYPFHHQVLARDCAYMDLPSGHAFTVWMMKFYPLAFLVVFDCPDGISFTANELSIYRDLEHNEAVRMDIDCTKIIHPHWPESPTDDSIILYGAEAAFARESPFVQPLVKMV